MDIALGEAKDECGAIDNDDVAKLNAARECFQVRGLHCYLTFSKTAPAFTPDEIELFRALDRDGVKLILFTNAELEPYQPYENEAHSPPLPHRHPMSMKDLSDNSRFRYLK